MQYPGPAIRNSSGSYTLRDYPSPVIPATIKIFEFANLQDWDHVYFLFHLSPQLLTDGLGWSSDTRSERVKVTTQDSVSWTTWASLSERELRMYDAIPTGYRGHESGMTLYRYTALLRAPVDSGYNDSRPWHHTNGVRFVLFNSMLLGHEYRQYGVIPPDFYFIEPVTLTA